MAENNSEGYQEAIRRINKWKEKEDIYEILNLSGLHLTALPKEIRELKNLQRLNLQNNQLSELPKEIGELKKIRNLFLFNNNIIKLPDQIKDLKSLEILSLETNELSELPKEIGELKKLQILYLDSNRLTELPKEIRNLKSLRKLSLINNQLRELPKEISELENLQELNLSFNQLTELPKEIIELKSLELLSINNNQLSELPKEISELENLLGLYLGNNQLSELPKEISELKNLLGLYLRGNDKLNIPPEIIEKIIEPQTILNYYFENIYQINDEDILPLKEVKVLIVGQGRVGKTSLIKYLINNEKCNPEEPSTHGIIRNKWKINVVEEKTGKEQDVQLNIWDFGGQDIQHQTHQFFLNQRSLYLLVLDAGRDEAGNKLDYWLKKIETVGKDAPILVAVNKSEQCLLPLAYTDLKEKFNIKGFFNISCETGQEIENLRETIKDEIGKIENVFEPIRKEWFAVKEYLENLEEDYISREEYRKICREKGVTERTSQDTLLILLHELGVMLNFKEHETEVLNPEWVTRGVYQMVTSLDVQMNKGVLTPALIESEIVKLQEQLHSEGKDYLRYPPEKYSFITDLMKKFELAYRIDETDDYFVPSLLPKDSPFVGDWNEKECVGFRYNYENGLLHETIMSRFIVKMNGYILNKTQWLTGVLLQNEHGNKALVKADLSNGYLNILIDGNEKTRREFLAIIRMKFNLLHKDNYPKQEIPLKEFPDEFVSYELLLQLEKEGIEESHTTVNGKLVKFKVKELLDGVSTANKRALELQIDEIYHDKAELEHRYKEGLKRGEEIARKKDKEINDIFGEYGEGKNTEINNSQKNQSISKKEDSFAKISIVVVLSFLTIFGAIVGTGFLVRIDILPESLIWVIYTFAAITIIILLAFVLTYLGKLDSKSLTEILSKILDIFGNTKKKE
ncbi:MAG TPA: COR domain-containing protein [Pyrinomonadaceae bacterium]|nr:COR domain-containing protein [Pyrinomonadaceae bacterium]